MMTENKLPCDEVWSMSSKCDNDNQGKKGKSFTTIIVCSIIILGIMAALTIWVFAVRPNFYPHLKIMSRSESETSSIIHHIRRRADVEGDQSEFVNNIEADIGGPIKGKKGTKDKKHISSATQKQEIKEIFDEVEQEDFPYNSTRLPRNLLPTDYYISLDVDLGKDSYTGVVIVNMKCKKEATFVIFHGRKIGVRDVSFPSDTQGDNFKVKRILFLEKTEMYLVEATKPFKKGKEYAMKIEFEADFNPALAGFYKSKYRGKDGNFRFVLVTVRMISPFRVFCIYRTYLIEIK